MRDVIIIGARCAGAATAMLLARKGCDVLLVDRATFPKDIPHGHFIHQSGPQRLARWGLLDRIVATGCPPVNAFTSDFGGCPLTGDDLVVDGVALGYGPRRAVLDKILVDAARESGAELREGFAVDDFTTDNGRVTGIVRRSVDGRARATETARIVVGADGRNSRLARSVGAPKYEATPPVTAWYFSYWTGVDIARLTVDVRGRRALFAFPSDHGLFAVFVGWAVDAWPSVRADVERSFMAAVDEVPEISGPLREGTRVERFYGMADLPNFLRKPYGPGWALVGDAGCHKDPFMALGICDAFRDAELLADALVDAFAGRADFDSALAGYEQRRNEATLPEYRQNLQMARFEPLPADLRALRVALQGDAAETRRFLLAMEGTIDRGEFFSADNVRRIVERSARRLH